MSTHSNTARRNIEVIADWVGLGGPKLMGYVGVSRVRGKDVFSFEYHKSWLNSQAWPALDPNLGLYTGPQHPDAGRSNFGMLLDSAPDRWGRTLMQRREALLARQEERGPRRLLDSDYLFGVQDEQRMGGLRFREAGRFLDDSEQNQAPPVTALRELAGASWHIEQDDAPEDADYQGWVRMLLMPGSSLGGARPKANVQDEQGNLWIAKFPSRNDTRNSAAWEQVACELAARAKVAVPKTRIQVFGSEGAGKGHHTFLSRRFDRTSTGARLHFASAMNLLNKEDGEEASYLELAEFLGSHGSQTKADLEQLWRRMLFYVCVSNTDDHLRNHGFLLSDTGWMLAPAYDINPVPGSAGLTLNISEYDNSQSIDLVMSEAPNYRLRPGRAKEILGEVTCAVKTWREVASKVGLAASAQDEISHAFRLAESCSA